MIRLFFFNICVFGGSFTLAIGPFVPAEEKLPPFRRDRLPLDESNIGMLALSIAALTQANTMHTPEERRHFAQAYAVISALLPDNKHIKERIESLENGDHSRTLNDPEKVSNVKANVWRTYDWLSSQDAGKDANILANYLGDVISAFDPENPTSKMLVSRADPQRWDGWVPPLDRYKEKEEIEETDDKPEETPKPGDQTPEKFVPAIRLENAELKTVLVTFDKEMRVWSPQPVLVTMKADKDDHKEDWEEAQSSLKVHVSADEQFDWPAHDMVAMPIKDLLNKSMKNLPRRGRISIRANDSGYPYNTNHGNLTGPGFVLAHACLTGKAPTGTVIGEIGRSGEMILPEHFWRQLMVLVEKGEGGRLVLPVAAVEYMPALLALGKTDFFLKYEVLIASNLDEFIALSSSEPSPEHAAVFAKFAEIVSKAPNGQVGAYVTNRFVRQRLQEIIQIAPYHISAKMHAIQGAGTHPRYLSKKVLAAEAWRSVLLTGEIAKVNFWDINTRQIARLDEIQEEMRTKLSALERFAESRDREVVKKASDIAGLLKILHRDLRGINTDSGSGMGDVMKTRDKLVDDYEDLEESLAELSGDPVSDDAGKRKRFRLNGDVD